MSDPLRSLLGVIKDGTALMGILGLGHIGVPLARTFLTAGFEVLGFDTDPAKDFRNRMRKVAIVVDEFLEQGTSPDSR